MIPLTLADDIHTTLLDYLTTTFNFQDEALETALVQFLEQREGGLFKGPYVHLRLPFRKAPADALIPLEIAPPFRPYVHQLRAFERLTSQGGNVPLPTLVTTGTGSGKTECFLYPILDHCYSQRGRPGIKAILLYPMNALASDQASRLARLIHDDKRLAGQVRAGIYIGGEGRGHTAMGPDHLIEDRAALRREPPDILLTNYKMLDFLLLRPDDRALWRHNEPETLRYLVLDELHTYDGAQGSDVACLLRRVQARLGTPRGFLCPVGTSATVLSDSGDTVQALTSFARQIFDQAFDPDSVIGEERLGLADFLPEPDPSAPPTLLPTDTAALAEQTGESHTAYLARQAALWLGPAADADPVALGQALCGHPFLGGLLACTRDSLLPLDDLLARLARWDPDFATQPAATQRLLLQSFLALIAHARTQETNLPLPNLPVPTPLLTLQVQLWVREMSRLMRAVEDTPGFFWRDDAPLASQRRGLPAYFCRECGHSGWLALRYEGDRQLTDDSSKIYNAYFDRSRHVRYVYPGSRPGELPEAGERLCPRCLLVDHQPLCPACSEPTFPVVLFCEVSTPQGARHPQDLQRCPQCGVDDALSIVGSQAATLSSVAISHLFASPLNSDKKLLAFTDSVQDAAHRAAFFGARTFRFNLRTAMQATLRGGQPIRLDDFAERMLAHWQGVWSGPAGGQKLAAAFMPPDLGALPAYRRYVEGTPQPIPPSLLADLRLRLSWEAAMEYGFNARLGRSLEKAGSSTALPDPDLLAAAAGRLALRLREELGLLRRAEDGAVQHFLLGLLERTRTRGGVYHPLLARFVDSQGNWFLLTKRQQPLLSPFHKRSRFPRFLTDQPQRDVFDAVISRSGRQTWYTDWAQRTLDPALGVVDVNEVYRLALAVLVDAGLLRHVPAGASYGLRSEALLVTRRTAGVQCRVCGHKHTVAADQQAAWLERPCLAYQCPGVYEADADFGQRYYRDIYERGHVERIFSYEHTGLLDRRQREALERHFKLQDRADAANLLTATPTLELGIDIGDLSATMACAVPPTTANYLQRIGRAGRKTGNSLILALANAQPHDLYFFEQPLEMIAGAITPPGCFLDAPNMLARQFLAFAMDRWTATMPVVKPLPHKVQKMLAGYKRGEFPADFLAFFDGAKGELIDAFLALFGAVVSPDNQQQLAALAAGDELPALVRAALAGAEAERASLQADRRSLRQRLEAIQADPSQYQEPQAEMQRLQQEMRVLQDLIKVIDDQYPLNFFTDAGLLPNYAFPETGVKLQVVVTGLDKEKDGDKGYLVKDYLRAAPLALRELAPGNTFYAEGRKLPIAYVETPGRAEAVESWQFCDRCAHLELVQASHYSSACPACGSPRWTDIGQRHDMVAFRQAAARVDHHESLVGDDADERERQSYQIGRHFEMRPEHSDGAFVLPSLPFGIEHMRQVTLREVNFGEGPLVGERVTIADEERPLHGFRVCQGCGLVAAGPTDGDAPLRPGHKRTCPHQSGNGQWRDIYLYRQMSSEALRILLPVSTVLIAEKLATFEACLDLGLRRKFGGNPDHLQIVQHQEPAADGAKRRYLVIFDTVPGGTSFLRDLARPGEFRQVLQLALDALTSCRCRSNPQKAACYRCLYSHRSQRDLALISRERGIMMLQEILGCWGELTPLASLSDAHMDSLVESELEQRFVDALAAYAARTAGCTWTPRLHDGRLAWELGLGERRWLMEAQVRLGAEQGVAVSSRADFVLWPLGADAGQALPAAVFTDGFAYHVQPQHAQGRIGDDLLKRRAARASGKFAVWSITWDDVEQFAGDGPPVASFLHDQAAQVTQFAHQQHLPLSGRLLTQDAVSQLLGYLRAPEGGPWQDLAGIVGFVTLTPPRPAVSLALLETAMQRLRSEPALPPLDIPAGAPAGDGRYSVVERYGWPLHLMVVAAEAGLRGGSLPAALSAVWRLEDGQAQRSSEGFVKHWRQFWLLDNLLQFLPHYTPVSAEFLHQFAAPAAGVPPQEPAAPQTPPDDPAWTEALRFADPACDSLLQACRSAGLPAPTVGFELLSAAGVVVAQAELAWPGPRVAVLLSGDEESRPLFVEAGWQVFDAQPGEAVLAALSEG